MKTVTQRITEFNAGRDRKLLAYKYHKMQRDVATFFRGTCHLFYEDWSTTTQSNNAPPVWLCGDLHLENFGSYRDETGSVRFDINDFDDAILAPCTWDLVRLLTSLFVAARAYKLESNRAEQFANGFLDAYVETVQSGQANMVDPVHPPDAIKKLMAGVQERQPRDLLDDRTKKKKKNRDKRELRLIEDRTMAISAEAKARITEMLDGWRDKQDKPPYDTVSDVIQRISGTGSLGVENYVILVETANLPEQYAVLHVKQATHSALAPYVTVDQPRWSSQARRVISTQRRIQGASPLLVPVGDGERSYVLHDLQPSADRVTLKKVIEKPSQLKSLATLAGQIVAWDQLRVTGHDDTATTKQLIDFTVKSDWRKLLLTYAKSYTKQVNEYFTSFRNEDADKLAKS